MSKNCAPGMCCYGNEPSRYGTHFLEFAEGLSLRIQVEGGIQNANLADSLLNPFRIDKSYAEWSNAEQIPSAGV